jgi:phosphatidylinositol alpha-1,6-mannosyltransferase
VAVVTSGLGRMLGGVGVVSEAIARALSRDLDVAIWRHQAQWPRWCRAPAFILRGLLGTFRRPDLIVFCHVDLARLVLVLPWLQKVPYVVFLHGDEVWNPLDRWRRVALERASRIFANSGFTIEKARQANPWLPDADVVWLGVGSSSSSTCSVRQPVVLILGRMASAERYKGHDAVIDAWPRVIEAVPGARLVIAGDGDDRGRLERKAARMSSVSFVGFVSDDDRQHLLDSAAVFVSVSTGEGFGLAGIEAAASGLPIVGLKGTVSDELFPDSSGHILLDAITSESLANALIRLLADRDLAHAIGEAGRRRAQSVFTVDEFNQRLWAAIAVAAPSLTKR